MGGLSAKRVICGAAFSAAAAIATPAAAGPCGGSYPVDRETTLSAVASACGVSYGALREANPGVDPGAVRPGEHLSIPFTDDADAPRLAGRSAGTNSSTEKPIPSVELADRRVITDVVADDTGIGSYTAAPDRVPNARFAGRVRARDARIDAGPRGWIRTASASGQQYVSTADRLSFQQRSAMRIANAGYDAAPTVFYADLGPEERATPSAPTTRLVACSSLRDAQGVIVSKVENIFAANETTFVEITEGPSGLDCQLTSASQPMTISLQKNSAADADEATIAVLSPGYRLPDYSKIGRLPSRIDAPASAMAPAAPASVAVTGKVVHADQGELLLQTEGDEYWRLSAGPGSEDLMGKTITAWGTLFIDSVEGGSGLAMAVSHAVYAEPW
ncbi:MAG: LysM domain-containing protein [Pseudomonadota bacterium]